MANTTLGQLITAHGVDVLDHLDRDAGVPVNAGLQVQGDLAVIPRPAGSRRTYGEDSKVPLAGIAVIEARDGGHEHRLLAGQPGTCLWQPARDGGQELGILECAEPAYLAHPEHGYLGIAPGTYLLRRQREQAEEERLVAD